MLSSKLASSRQPLPVERTFLNIGLRGLPRRTGGVYVSVGIVANPERGVKIEIGRTEVLLPTRADADFSLRVELTNVLLELRENNNDQDGGGHAVFEAFAVGAVNAPQQQQSNDEINSLTAASDNYYSTSLGRWSCPLSRCVATDAIGLLDTHDAFLGSYEPVFSRMKLSASTLKSKRSLQQQQQQNRDDTNSKRGPNGTPREVSDDPPPTIIVTPIKASDTAVSLGILRLEMAFTDISSRIVTKDQIPELRNPFILIERRNGLVEPGRLAPPDLHDPAIVSLPIRGGGQLDSVTASNDPRESFLVEVPLVSLLRVGSCRGNIGYGNGLLETLANERQVARFSVYDWIDAGQSEPTFEGPLGFIDVALHELLNPATIAHARQNCIITPLQANDGKDSGGAIIFRRIFHGPWTLPPPPTSRFASSSNIPRSPSSSNIPRSPSFDFRSNTPPGLPPSSSSNSVREAGTPTSDYYPQDNETFAAPSYPYPRYPNDNNNNNNNNKRPGTPPGAPPPPPSAYNIARQSSGPAWDTHGAMLPNPSFSAPRQTSSSLPNFSSSIDPHLNARPVNEMRASRLGVGFSDVTNAIAAPMTLEAVNLASIGPAAPAARMKYMASLAAASSSFSSIKREASAPMAVRTVGDARSKLLLAPTIHSALGLRPGATGLLPSIPPFTNAVEAYSTGRAVTSSSLGLSVQRNVESVFLDPRGGNQEVPPSPPQPSILDLFGPPKLLPAWSSLSPPPILPRPSSPSSSSPLSSTFETSSPTSFLSKNKASNSNSSSTAAARARGVTSATAARLALANPKYTLSEFSSLLSEARASGSHGDFLIPQLMTLEHSKKGPRATATLIAAACAESEVARHAIDATSIAVSAHLRADLILLQRSINDAREEDAASARTLNARAVLTPLSSTPQIDTLPIEAFLDLEQAATLSRVSLARGVAALEAVAAPSAIADFLATGLSAAHPLLINPPSKDITSDMANYDAIHDDAMRLSVRHDVAVSSVSIVKNELRSVIQTVDAERVSLENERYNLGETLACVATDVGKFEGFTWEEPELVLLNTTYASRFQKRDSSSSASAHQESASCHQLMQLSMDPLDSIRGRTRRQEVALANSHRDTIELINMQYAPLLSALREKTLMSLADVKREGEERLRGELGSADGVFHAGLRDAARAREEQADEVSKLLGISRMSTIQSLPSSIALTYERYIRPTSNTIVSRLDIADEEARIIELSRVAAEEIQRLRTRLSQVDADLVRVGARDRDSNMLAALRRHLRTLPAWQLLPINDRRTFFAKTLKASRYSSGLSAFLRSEVYPHSASRVKQIARSPPLNDSKWLATLGSIKGGQ